MRWQLVALLVAACGSSDRGRVDTQPDVVATDTDVLATDASTPEDTTSVADSATTTTDIVPTDTSEPPEGSDTTPVDSTPTSDAPDGDEIEDTTIADTGPCESFIAGTVEAESLPIIGARVTLEGPAGYFVELRSAADGTFAFDLDDVPAGDYRLGVAARDYGYQERTLPVVACAQLTADFALEDESDPGRTAVLGDPGERLGGTNSGVLMPDGDIIYCHDTRDPVIFDPVTNTKTPGPESPRIQGCHAVTLMPDGKVLYVGGADQPIYGPGTKQVKTFDPVTRTWKVLPDLVDYRWYPTMIPLPDGEIVTAGGGGQLNPIRTKTSETFDPVTQTWTAAGDLALGNEVSPIILLYNGKALMTHRPPQLYDPATRKWTLAGDFVQGNRMSNGDHADHELVLLGDGRVLAFGHKSFVSGQVGKILEEYDPTSDTWSLGPDFAPARSRPSAVLLPDGRVLVMSGEKEDPADPTPVNQWNYMALVDLYDPAREAWRRLTPMSMAREYHMMPILVPDGRVMIVGGEGAPGNEPPASTIEAYSPPYLFRGPRPEIVGLDQTTFTRGASLSFRVAKTRAPTEVLLIGTSATTHFMDSGNGRHLALEFTQTGDAINATIPTDRNKSVLGWYMLFVMVDDIPSIGRIVRIVGS